MSNGVQIEIKTLEGAVKHRFGRPGGAGAPSWNQIFFELTGQYPHGIAKLDFSSAINEKVSLKDLAFRNCVLDFDNMERSSFVSCRFDETNFHQSNFHHLADRADKSDRSMGTLFKDCHFEECTFHSCDFVMSKFYGCAFNKCRFISCDLRNVWWFDKFTCNPPSWEAIPKMPDPFKTCMLKDCRFGHPMSNVMNLPVQMMIPRSYETVWSHMGAVQRKLTRVAYMMREESGEVFASAI